MLDLNKKRELVPTTRKLVEFLRELALSKDRLVRDISKYEAALFLDRLPPQIERSLDRMAGPEDLVFVAPLIKSEPTPTYSADLQPYIRVEDLENSSLDEAPFIFTTPPSVLAGQSAREWASKWSRWAAQDRLLAEARDWHRTLSRLQRLVEVQDDEFEAVLGIGFLTASFESTITRLPFISVPITLSADPVNGNIEVRIQPSAKARPIDRRLLEGAEFYDHRRLSDWRQKVLDWEPQPLAEEARDFLAEWIDLAVDRAFPFSDTWTPQTTVERSLELTWSPCLIVRSRDRSNLVEYFDRMIGDLERDGAEAPLGLAQLVAAIEAEDRVQWLESDGHTSAEVLGGDPLFPLPSNPEQRQIVATLRRDNGVVVQGPPGTGKTHTIANLVSALLAQGQRVLVTSQKAQALRVLREKMPEEIQKLCVSMTDVARGGSKELNSSVTAMSDAYGSFSPELHNERVNALEARRHSLRMEISKLKEGIRAARETETYQYTEISAGYSGTLATIAELVRDQQARFSWFPLPLPSDSPVSPELTAVEFQSLLQLLRGATPTRRSRAHQVLPSLGEVPSVAEIESLILRERASDEAAKSGRTTWTQRLEGLPREDRQRLMEHLRGISLLVAQLSVRSSETWIDRALDDAFKRQNSALWKQLSTDLAVLSDAQSQLSSLGLKNVSVPELETKGHVWSSVVLADLHAFQSYLANGGAFKKGLLRGSSQKKIQELLDTCAIDGLPIRTKEALGDLVAFLTAENLSLKAIERLKDVGIEVDDTLRLVPRLQSLVSIQSDLEKLIRIQAEIEQSVVLLIANRQTSYPMSMSDVADAIRGLESCDLIDDLQLVKDELSSARSRLNVLASAPRSAPELRQLERSIELRDIAGYSETYEALAKSHAEQDQQEQCDELMLRLQAGHPALAAELEKSCQDEVWSQRLSVISEAWAWAVASRFLSEKMNSAEELELQDKLRGAIADLGNATAKLAAEQAWGHCLSKMTANQERALRSYQENISSKGKGAGKWASRYAKAARHAMIQAREAVPAWIMPLNEVIDTIPPDQNSFDVVIIDEASQAGIEALFLLWLAPRIIVVGDERQCAPAGVVRGGLQPIFDRLDEYLPDLPDYLRLGFTPKSNLFSLLSTRFGSVVRLREHFRCMPEIIGWSSTQFYSDSPLIPLRQFGSDRLRPLVTTHVQGGYTEGSSSTLINRPEAEAIVKQIQLCLLDPAYRDKSIGVIALQSPAQVRLLDDLIDEAVPADLREARRLRVGTPPDFQGDERNVVFISMVVAEREKITSMTQRDWQRRFNVAATRAEDQLWLFHSPTVDYLKPTDLRRSLLTYVMHPPQVFGGEQHLDLRWESERRHPFGSKFEQRVFLKIREKGYFVTPQFEVNGRFIDLVITGAKGRLAVECDGDYWHSSREDQLADLDRQLELERAGWRFVRIRESDFNRDPDRSLEGLWAELDRRGIRPNDLVQEVVGDAASWTPLALVEDEGLDGMDELNFLTS